MSLLLTRKDIAAYDKGKIHSFTAISASILISCSFVYIYFFLCLSVYFLDLLMSLLIYPLRSCFSAHSDLFKKKLFFSNMVWTDRYDSFVWILNLFEPWLNDTLSNQLNTFLFIYIALKTFGLNLSYDHMLLCYCFQIP